MDGKRILIVGRMMMKLVLNMYKLPAVGESLLDDGGVAYIPAGEGAIPAMVFSRLGADAILAGRIGADAHGQRLYKYYKDAGINTSRIKVDREEPTALTVAMREASGERELIYPGASARFAEDSIAEAFGASPDALYLGLGLPWDMLITSARIASARGVPIFVDGASAISTLPLEELPLLEIFSPNEEETRILTGISPDNLQNSLRAALSLRKRINAKYIVIKQGERGAFIYDGKKYFVVAAAKAGKAVDPTMAGDVFTAGMTVEYLNHSDIRAAVQFGAAAAAIAVTREGMISSVPTTKEVRELMLSTGYGY